MQREYSRGFDLEQIDIAPTIAKIMKMPFQSDGKIIKGLVSYGEGCNHILLIIIDSFGYSQYIKSKRLFHNISNMLSDGRFYICKANANKTTPAIASILCGKKPEVHRIYKTSDVHKSCLKSILEVASEQGIKSAIVMEEEGALTFEGRIDIIKSVKDREDIIEFDDIVKDATIEAMREDCRLIITHLRALDDLGYTPKAISSVDGNILEIAKACVTNGLIILCGDHPPHDSKEYLVPLIAKRLV